MDWLEQLNAERRESAGKDDPPRTEFRPPSARHVLALLAVVALFLFAMAGLHGRETHFGFAATLQSLVLGFWVGAGRNAAWIRWGCFALSSFYFRLLLGNLFFPMEGVGMSERFNGSTISVGVIGLVAAVFSYSVPRLIAPREVRVWDRQFSLSDMMLTIGAVALACVLWGITLNELNLSAESTRRYFRQAATCLPGGVVFAAVGSRLVFRDPQWRRKVTQRAVWVCLGVPPLAIVVALMFPRWLDEEAGFSAVLAAPASLGLLYPIDFVANGFGVPWLRKLDKNDLADDEM